MNFQDFQATRTACADLGAATSPEWFLDADGNEATATGFLYDGDCYIQQLANGSYYLILGNEETVSQSLDELELVLHTRAADEGLFN